MKKIHRSLDRDRMGLVMAGASPPSARFALAIKDSDPLISKIHRRLPYGFAAAALAFIPVFSASGVMAAPALTAQNTLPKNMALTCEKTAPKTSGPAWIHLTMQVEKLVSLRSGGPKNAPVQLPTTDIVAFDGYLPADGSDILTLPRGMPSFLSKVCPTGDRQ